MLPPYPLKLQPKRFAEAETIGANWDVLGMGNGTETEFDNY